MRTVSFLVRTCLLFCFSALASANPQQLLTDLHQMRLAATAMVTNYYMFSGLEADSKYNRLIDSSLSRFDSALKSAATLAKDDAMSTELQAIDTDWQALLELLEINRNDILSKGFAENRLVDDMGRAATKLVEEISADYRVLQQKSGVKPLPAIEKSRSLAVLMAEMTARYAAEGMSSLGYLFVGTGENTQPLAELADQFQQQLAELSVLVSGQGAEVLTRNIASKWRFVENRIRHNNEDSVPFLVVSYNDRILEHLAEIESKYR